MGETYIIDRIEGDFIVAEADDGTMINISKAKTKGEFKEGDVLIKDREFFTVDSELTKKRKEKIDHIMKNMWQ